MPVGAQPPLPKGAPFPPQCVKLLVSMGCSVNKATKAGKATALHRAAFMGHLEAGAGGLPLYIFCPGVPRSLLEARVAAPSRADVLWDAHALRGVSHRLDSIRPLQVVRYLLEHGADVALADADGETALHKASAIGPLLGCSGAAAAAGGLEAAASCSLCMMVALLCSVCAGMCRGASGGGEAAGGTGPPGARGAGPERKETGRPITGPLAEYINADSIILHTTFS